MKNEDAVIVGLTIVVLIVGAIAMMVTGMMANVNTDAPVESSATYTNNTTNITKNTTSDSAQRDTGVIAPSSSAQSSSSSSSSGSSYSGSSSGYVPSDTSSGGRDSSGSYSGRSESGGSSSGQGGQAPSDLVTISLD